jgi:molybdopterin converting factor subunit 1
MKVHVQLFARARDLAGVSSVTLELPAHAAVADLRRLLDEKFPQLARLLERSAVAVNNEFADNSVALTSDAEVALLPPVSGG